jgi:thioredoxin reductase
VDSALVHIELVPNTGYVKGVAPLDGKGQVIVNGRMQSEVPYVLAAGDVRAASPGQMVTAVGNGAITAEKLLQHL